MSTVKAIWQNGQVVLDGRTDWPEGRRLLVVEAPPGDMEIMSEADQRDDPDAVGEWIDDMRAIPPLPMTPEQEAELLAWRQRVETFNLDAVHRQMEEGIP